MPSDNYETLVAELEALAQAEAREPLVYYLDACRRAAEALRAVVRAQEEVMQEIEALPYVTQLFYGRGATLVERAAVLLAILRRNT